MEEYFNIRYEFDKATIHQTIDQQLAKKESAYICVADGVVLNTVNRDADYREAVNNSMFAICDSSWVPVYIKWIYGGKKKPQYCGSDIFKDIISMKKYRMAFLGGQQKTLDSLRKNLSEIDASIADMLFYELPFLPVEDFNYEEIANKLTDSGAEIIWVSLGAPKQDFFMNRLQQNLPNGVMLGVGAAFNFFSDVSERRAPKWMVKAHLEFIFRLTQNPQKQMHRCWNIIKTMPAIFMEEIKKKKQNK